MRKTATALLSATALVFTLLPQPGFAAESVQINDVHTGDRSVVLRYEGAQAKDWYHLYIGERSMYGTLSAEEAALGTKILDVSGLGTPGLGEEVRVEMKGAQPGSYVTDSVHITTGNAQDIGLTLNGDLTPGGGAQHLTVTVKGPYDPKASDIVRVTPYDAADTALESMQLFQVPAGLLDSENRSFQVALVPGEDVDHYKVELLRDYSTLLGSGIFSLTGEPVVEEKKLRLAYPSGNVAAGAAVTGQVFIKDEAGKEIDVASLAMFTYDGPIAEGSFRQGTFEVAADARAGDKIRITAQVADYTESVELTVGETTTPAPDPDPTPTEPGVGASKVVMTLQSTTLQVDGKDVETEVAPFITDGRTLVPLRVLAESFGATVEFDPQTYVITIVQGDQKTVMTVFDTNYTVNGVGKTMDRAPYIAYSGRTIVPVRFVAEGLGYEVDVVSFPDGSTKEVVFTK